jgi:Spy/CpxP family protein refolding chaperone
MNNPTWRYAVVFVLGMLIGLAGGAWGFRCFFHAWAKKDPSQFFLHKMEKELKLTADQKTKVEAILSSKRAEMEKMRDTARPQFEAIRMEGEKEIRALLTPDQTPKFDELVQKMEKRRAEMPWAHGCPPSTPAAH